MSRSLSPRFRLRPFELVAWGGALAIGLFVQLAVVPLGWASVRYMAAAMAYRLPPVILAGFVLHFLVRAVRRDAPVAWLREALAPASLALLARLWLAAIAVTYAYSWLKVSVPLLTPRLHDPALWRLDRALHLGVSPNVFAVEALGPSGAAPALDLWYALWITSVLLVQSVLFLAREPSRRRNFALACALLWLAGAVVYALVPAVGPAFYTPDVFAAVAPRMPHTTGMGAELWRHYTALVAARDAGGSPRLVPFLAVAAMPSLHVGAHALFAFWAKRHARRWLLPALVATGLTFAGSLLSGWHYAVDGYVGILLAWGAARLADRWEPVAEPVVEPAVGSIGEAAAAEPVPPPDPEPAR